MENATKAAIMTATTLIGVMILTLIVYLFRTGAVLGDTYESNRKTVEIETFNSKITPYQRTAGIYQATEGASIVQSNSFLDVISACNYAYSTNKINDQDRRNGLTVEIEIDDDHYYSIFPDPDSILEEGEVYIGTVEDAKASGLSDSSNKVKLYDILDKTSLSYTDKPLSTIIHANNGGLIYMYNFDGELLAGTSEGDYDSDIEDSKISYIKFTLVKLEDISGVPDLLAPDYNHYIDRE